MSGADIPAGSSDPPTAVRTFSRGADDAGDAGSTGSGDRHDDQLERQCGECCVPLDELDGNDTSASDAEYFKTVVWTAAMGTAVDAVLAVVKFASGFTFNSSALVADAVHSASDVVSDLVVIAAARYASAPPDARYPYGRGRWEAVATLFVSAALAWAASTLIVEFTERLIAVHGPFGGHLDDPGVSARSRLPRTRNALLEFPSGGGVASDDFRLATEEEDPAGKNVAGVMDSAAVLVALVSVFAKEAAFQVTNRIANRIGSKVLAANAWHHRSDAVSAFAALVGVAGAYATGLAWLDAAAGVAVSALVLKAGWEIGKGATMALVDANVADGEVQEAVEASASEALGSGAKSPTVAGLRARRYVHFNSRTGN